MPNNTYPVPSRRLWFWGGGNNYCFEEITKERFYRYGFFEVLKILKFSLRRARNPLKIFLLLFLGIDVKVSIYVTYENSGIN
jgi:hypothetical protein